MIEVILKNSNYIWLLDSGHGGIIDGTYQTKGKRSPKLPDGRILYEGEYNRDVVNRIASKLCDHEVSHSILVPEQLDISLRERVKRADEIAKNQGKKCVYVSVHANAFGNGEFNNANGVETFYFSKNGRFSKTGKMLAGVFQKHLVTFSQRNDRTFKGANYYVLRETSMPSVLTESPFMTNLEEAKLMLTNEFRESISVAHFQAIVEIDKNKLLG